MPDDFLFVDREEAALLLSKRLTGYRGSDAVVFAVPRGGVPIGAVVARELDLPLEVVLVKKLGHPVNPEFAIGSVSLRNVRIERISPDISREFIRQETERLQQELKRRHQLFTSGRKLIPVKNRRIILVDDGIATGSTLLAAAADLRESGASEIVVAVPVAPPGAAGMFRKICDDYIVLYEPRDFGGVGQFYADFRQVTDEEVVDTLKSYWNRAKVPS